MTPSLNQRLAELRIADLHAEAAHARLVKEARNARRAARGPSRLSVLMSGFGRTRPEPQPARAAESRWASRRVASKPVTGC